MREIRPFSVSGISTIQQNKKLKQENKGEKENEN